MSKKMLDVIKTAINQSRTLNLTIKPEVGSVMEGVEFQPYILALHIESSNKQNQY